MAGETNTEWWNAWGQLRDIIAKMDQSVALLTASRDYALANPTLREEYTQKMADVESMRTKALWLRDNIKSAMASFGVVLSGAQARGAVETGLGIAPLLLWPVVAAGVAWLGSKALDLFEFSQRVDEQRRLEQTGLTPKQAADIVTQTGATGGILGNVKTIVLLGVVALGAWWLYQNRSKFT